ncbi:MAG TPA: PA2169 family four-helix-bundle protein [Gemmatimonadales bacterium]|nr:PA2169 family four-helix-bundle protein [Gemmatimonadales bacterium]
MSTTTDTEHAVDVLNQLLETARDGEKGFNEAAESTDNPDLRATLQGFAAQRAAFVTELTQLIRSVGGDPHESGHVAGALHRGWMNVKEAFSKREDKAILEECERGEDYAKKSFTEALDEPLPENVRTVVQRMASEVKMAHDRVRGLRDRARAAS